MQYELHIFLTGIQPSIWRLLRVPGGVTLTQLHHILNAAVGWTNSHLHEFQIRGIKYTDPETAAEAKAVARAGFNRGGVTKSEQGIKLEALGLKPRQKFIYVYDFGDDWAHEVIVKKVLPDEAGGPRVALLDGARACPPEDCGGVGGYENMLQAVRDPRHPEHQEFLDWLGGAYDPEAFPMQKIKPALNKIRFYK